MAKFKTRARAVDMLGRQQIAGVPSAISELFKNAHDAYADHVEVDYFRSDGLFILRDDGLGMTKNDFEERWLTIGTESKFISKKGIQPPPIDPNKTLRPIAGEKGIGRLAIAVIGPQVLVLTRAKLVDEIHELVASFIHWGLFEAPGINLEQIEIPIQTFTGSKIPDNNDIQKLVNVVRQNVLDLKKNGFLEKEFASKIILDLEKFDLNPAEISNDLGAPSLLGERSGTHFYILPATENLTLDLETDLGEKEISRVRKLLLGFTNTMMPSKDHQPSLTTAFRYWPTNQQSKSIIDNDEFFTPTDFEKVDHYIDGQFDKLGQFKGTISIYGKKKIPYIIPWQKDVNIPITCGPFNISFGYVQGRASESKLPAQIHTEITQKLNRIGGLYIYKDDIRILPYGDFDVDFLGFEKRRNKSFSEGFFSYRRMFGAIELNRETNGNLVEKAGREGFQENRAYRDFKAVLENFFIQLAADFFLEGGANAEVWMKTREEMGRLAVARKQQEKESRKKRHDFETHVKFFFQQIDNGIPQQDVDTVLKSLKNRIEKAARAQDQIALLDAEVLASREMSALRNKYKVELPQGVGLGSLRRDWKTYTIEAERLEKELFTIIQVEINSIVSDARQQLNFALDQKQRIDLLVNEIIIDARNSTQQNIESSQKAFDALQNRFKELSKQINGDLQATANEIESEITKLNVSEKTDDEIEIYRRRWENRVNEEAKKYNEVLVHIQTQVNDITWYQDENGYLIGNAEITAALEDEVLVLRERADADLELTQIGMALDIINHEFSNTIKSIRNNLRTLKSWANLNPKLQPIYRDINNSFAHLDGYLTLFTPLNRRLSETHINISGSSIAKYINELFKERLERHEISLISTDAFLEINIGGYTSTFYPVFINLVDNAIFWLKNSSLPREITLDADGNTLIVSDNGPGVSSQDREAIFMLGFTRKTGGRGMGLYISQEILKKDKYQLSLSAKSPNRGATFRIYPIQA
jgi:signal transduction histidine kinase